MTLISSEISEKDAHISLLKSINNNPNNNEDFSKLYLEKKHLVEKLKKENERKYNVLAENDRLINEVDENYKEEEQQQKIDDDVAIN